MQAFYFTKSVTLRLGDQVRPFVAPADFKSVPFEEIWIDTRFNSRHFKDYVFSLGSVSEDNPLFTQLNISLPLCLNGGLNQTSLFNKENLSLDRLKKRLKPGKKLRIALFNAFGTGLGDNFVGMQMFQLVLTRLRSLQPVIEVDVIRTWQSTKPDFILKDEPWVNRVLSTPFNLSSLVEYDAYFDFSDFANLPGFLTRPWPDFQLINLGIDPDSIPDALKQARYKIRNQTAFDYGVDQVQHPCKGSDGVRIFLHAQASSYLRSIPKPALEKMLSAISSKGHHVFSVDDFVTRAARDMGIECTSCQSRSLDELCGIVHACDRVISSETFLLHVGNAVARKVIGLFVSTGGYKSGQMLPYQTNLYAINVDTENRVSSHFKMTQEALIEQGHHDYFMQSWDRAIEKVIRKIPG